MDRLEAALADEKAARASEVSRRRKAEEKADELTLALDSAQDIQQPLEALRQEHARQTEALRASMEAEHAAEIDDARSKLRDARAEAEQLRGRVDDLVRDLEYARGALERQQAATAEAHAKAQALESEARAATHEAMRAGAAMREAQEKKTAAEEEAESLRASAAAAQLLIDNLKAQRENDTKALALLQIQARQTADDNEMLNDEVEQLMGDVLAAEREAIESVALLEAARSQLSDFEATNDEWAAQVATLQAKVDTLEEAVEAERDQRRADVATTSARWNRLVDVLNDRLDEETSTALRLETERLGLEAELDDANERALVAEQELSSARRSLANARANLRDVVEELEAARTDSRERDILLQRAEDRVRDLQLAVAEEKATSDAASKRADAAKGEAASLSAMVSELRGARTEAEVALASTAAENEDLRDDVADLKAKVDRTAAEVIRLTLAVVRGALGRLCCGCVRVAVCWYRVEHTLFVLAFC